MCNDKTEHDQKCGYSQNRLDQTAPDGSVGNGANPVTDHTLPDQIGQQPVGTLHGDIAQRFPDAVVGKGDLPGNPLPELLQKRFKGITVIIVCCLHGREQVVLLGKPAEDGVAESDAVPCIDVAEGSIFLP